MTEVIFLGVGGAMAVDPADNHTALVVRHENLVLLLDCGPTIMRQLENTGLTAGDPTHVIISHQHGDHTLGLPMLLLNRVLFWPKRPLLVLAMPPVLTMLQELTRLAYPDLSRHLAKTVEFVALNENEGHHVLPKAAGVSYATAPAQHSVPAWGLRLTFGAPANCSLVYSGDTAPTPAMAELAAGADLLVHDTFFLTPPPEGYVGHSAAAHVGAIAAAASVGTLALVHREHTEPTYAEQYCAAAHAYFGGRVMAPAAGDTFRM